jgi:RimJ/RimL family protein N-acetyltransferase
MIIRRYEHKDHESVYQLVMEFGSALFSNLPAINRENVIIELLKYNEHGSIIFCIFEDGLKGFLTINHITRDSAFLGNIVVNGGSQFLGLNAGKWSLDYCFNVLNINRVYGHTWSDNPKMDAFYQRIGATHEGTEREHSWKNGKYVDLKIWGILRKEFVCQ